MSKQVIVTMKKIGLDGKPTLLNGEEVHQDFNSIHADNIMQQKVPYWEVVNDPRLEVKPPKSKRPSLDEIGLVSEAEKPKKKTKKKK